MRFWKLLFPFVASTLSFGAQDRITSPIDSSAVVGLAGSVHGLAQPRFDLGRADGSKLIHGVTLEFRPSAEQQKNLDTLLAQQQDRSSRNFHKWLTPAQFADRFGMTRSDIDRVVTWIESQGFNVTAVSNSRNQISFDGTVAQIESEFGTEIHNYLVDGEIHFANASDPSVPAALAESVLAIGHLHNFSPKPRIRAQRHFTSAASGNHFLTPGDFATIYDLAPLYNAGIDGTGQKIAIVGQSAVNLTDLSNFRSNAGLAPKGPSLVLYPSSSTSAHCSGDESESDLDLEWSGGIANNASVIFVYAGLVGGDKCGGGRSNDVWNALQNAVDTNVAPVISISYGFCEQLLPAGFPKTVEGWAKQANSQGQTIVSATGDDGGADCDRSVRSTTHGPAVDVPAAIPEVTGAGGTEFTQDAQTGANQYWSGTTGGIDDISSALSYIPETAWNDTAANLSSPSGTIGASGGGASTIFAKPVWQTGPGVPNDNKRDVPDIALSASPDHDGYLICSPTDGAGNPACTVGFRDSSTQGFLDVIGGTSAAAPSFAGILALLNQYLVSNGFQATPGLGNVNSNLYFIASYNTSALHDITSGDNLVPCTAGTTGCPASGNVGFKAGAGYDQVTGLGSVDANALALAWGQLATATQSTFTLTTTANTFPIAVGGTATINLTVNSSDGFINTSNNTTILPLTYSCSAFPAAAEISCQLPNNGQPTFATAVTVVIKTTPVTTQLYPASRGRIFYALLFPGILGVVFSAASGSRSLRLLSLTAVLGFSTLWLGACGGGNYSNNSQKNAGTPPGSYPVTITATTGGSSPVSSSIAITVTVTPQ